jgi:hypothetical protein
LKTSVYRRAVVLSRKKIIRNYKRISNLNLGKFEIVIPEAVVKRFLPALTEIPKLSNLRSSGEPANALLAQVPLTHLLGVEGKGASRATQAIWLISHVLAVRSANKGEAVSYGGTYVLGTQRILGLVPVGFADGMDRKLSGHLSVELPTTFAGWVFKRFSASVLGRIAMDSISIDLGKSSRVKVGQRVEVFGPKSEFSISDAAQRLGIQPGEIALRLSERAEVILCR